MLYVPKWWVVSWRPCRWNVTAENCPCPVFVTHANHCLSCSFFSPGTSGISLSHNFYSGSIFKSNSIWTSLSSQRLPPQWLEFTRFYNCGSRVSTCIMSVNVHLGPLGTFGSMKAYEGWNIPYKWCEGLLSIFSSLSHVLPSVTAQSENTVNSCWSSVGVTWFMLISVCSNDLP